MGLASCSWPIWQTDDFSSCFLHDYLKILLPLIVIGLSFLQLLVQNALRAVKIKRGRGYQRVSDDVAPPPSHNHTVIPPDQLASEDEEDDALTIHGGRLALVKTTTKGSIVQADIPPAQTLSVMVEELAIAGLVAVNAIALVRGAYGDLSAVVGLTVWVYVLILASLRLFLGNSQWRVPRLWNHTAAIYSLQWLFTLVLFRSVIIHPSSRLTQSLVVVEFSLTTLLFSMAIFTRKGNKTVLLEWEDGIEPGREHLASLFSHYTFSWVDSIIWKGWKEPMDISKVWNLLPKDKAATVLASYRQFKKTASLALHLVKYFKGMLVQQALWGIAGGVLTFAPTLLLKAILEYVENADGAPLNILWLYVILLPVSDVIRSVCDGQALYIGRKICINIRAILVGEIFAKALRRKASASKDTNLGENKAAQASEDGFLGGFLTKVKKTLGLAKDRKDGNTNGAATTAVNGADKTDDKANSTDEQANMGTIINLMSVDSFKVSEVTAYLHYLVAVAPAQLLVSVYLLYRVMGLSAIPGFIVMAILLPVNIAFGRGFNITQKKIMAATDKRIHSTNEILQNIRIIKYFSWEHRFSEIVDEKRRVELIALRNRFILWSIAVGVWNMVPLVIMFFCFFCYTVIEEKPLYPSVAFTAISLFMLLRYPLDQIGDMLAHVWESKVSIDRIEEFLAEEETEKFEQLGQDNTDESGKRVIGFRDATFIWGSKTAVADDGSMAFRLLDLNIDFKLGKLNIITGPTGSGKTSMLMALLGEMSIMKGQVFLPGGRSREEVRPDPETGLAETCAYVSQQAWLVNASIKENILFSSPFDEQRYKDVIVACALEHDLDILDNGDETLVGEKGITLSGGQKQRISLARAMYSNSKHLLMDDCLSAVDAHTAQWIFNNAIMGPLMRHRTCILVSHNISLCVPFSDHVVILNNGRVTAQGTPKEVIASGKLGEDILQKSAPGSAHVSRVPSRVPSSVGEESGATLINEADGASKQTQVKAAKKEKKKQNAMEETAATGAVKWAVLKLYVQSMGSWWFWLVVWLVFGAQQLLSVASNFWVKQWSNQYLQEETLVMPFSANPQVFSAASMSPAYFASIATCAKENSTFSVTEERAKVDVSYYLTVLAVIGLGGALVAFFRDLWVFFGSLTASRRLHTRLMKAVTGARFRFFDQTPLGQMMNRFSKDLEGIDQEVASVAIGVLNCALGIIVTVVIIGAITPQFLAAGIVITLAYIFLGNFYLSASRDLKRLESVERSPLFQQFGETLTGVTTIRAYGDERRFVRENIAKINKQLRPFIYLWAANRWLAFRTDALGDLVSFFAGVFVIFSLGKVSPGSAGLSLSYAIGFADNMLWLVRLYAMNEQNMNSVERIKEYLDVEQEAPAVIEKNRPPLNWPSNGSVEFINYTTSYRKGELDPVLRNLTFKINGREKVGIVGRTGAGKSSLALAILRALEADEGKILIDDIDIGLIGLRDLREAITIVPQDPTLFMGTIRTNLDPFNLYSDEQLFDALRRVHLIGPDEQTSGTATPLLPQTPTIAVVNGETEESRPSTPGNKNIFLDLSSPVTESGTNLSQGQRQLLCLARALLKIPHVLVMDEATASIDYATDSAIQETIREQKNTIITIAHRLQTVVDYDKVLVLDKGSVVEYAHPWELIQKEGGTFKSMCEMSGDLETLSKLAKKAYKAKQLVDVDEEEPVSSGSSSEGPKPVVDGDMSAEEQTSGVTPEEYLRL